MTASADHVMPLFATPFAAVDTGASPTFNARLAGLCESRRQAAELRDAAPGPLHYRGREDFLDSDDATVDELRRLICSRAAALVAGWSSLDPAQFSKLQLHARGWCSIVQPDGHVPAQHFADASWLAVYCVQASAPSPGISGAGMLRLYERRLQSIYRDPSTWQLKPPFGFGNHAWTPAPGWMALFPAYLPHEVSVVRSATALILVFAMIRFTV